MPRLGSLVLAGVLLGVPRALDARSFGAQRSVYVEVWPQAPELAAFAAALERALGAGSWRLASCRTQATVVIDVLNVASATDALGRRMEAVSLVVRDRREKRRLILHGPPSGREGSAARLLERLDAFEA